MHPGQRRHRAAAAGRAGAEAELPLSRLARWATAAATLAGLALLVGALGSSPLTIAMLAAGTIAGAARDDRGSAGRVESCRPGRGSSSPSSPSPVWRRSRSVRGACRACSPSCADRCRSSSCCSSCCTASSAMTGARRGSSWRSPPSSPRTRQGSRRRPTRLVARRLGSVLLVGHRRSRHAAPTGRRGTPGGRPCAPSFRSIGAERRPSAAGRARGRRAGDRRARHRARSSRWSLCRAVRRRSRSRPSSTTSAPSTHPVSRPYRRLDH